MSNVGARNALGVTLFASLDDIGSEIHVVFGPAARYRRWLGESGSVDLGVGVTVAAGDDIMSGSLFGLVKVSPNPWVGIALRPELVRRSEGSFSNPESQSHFRAALGIELGDMAGLVAGPVLAGLAILAGFASSSN